MPQSKKAAEEVAPQDNGAFQVPEGWASVLFDNAFKLQEEYTGIVGARKANRESLRNLAAQNLLSDEEVEMMNELYPVRSRNKTGDDEAATTTDTAPEPVAA